MKKIGQSKYEKICSIVVIVCNGMIISFINNKIWAFILVLGICFSAIALYNAIKEIEAFFYKFENVKKPESLSVILFAIGLITSLVSIYFTFNCILAYLFVLLYHLLIALCIIPLFLLMRTLGTQGTGRRNQEKSGDGSLIDAEDGDDSLS